VLERTAARERHAAAACLAELEQMRSAFAEAVAERDALVRIQAAAGLPTASPERFCSRSARHWPVGTGPPLGSPR
jgi:hypothetical protein